MYAFNKCTTLIFLKLKVYIKKLLYFLLLYKKYYIKKVASYN